MFLSLCANPTVDLAAEADQVVATVKLRCSRPRVDPGGGGINVARVLTRLGAECRAVAPIGGADGARLGRILADDGVALEAVMIAGDTRQSLTILDRGQNQQYRFVFPGPELAVDEWQACLARLDALAGAGDDVIASGSLAPGMPDDFYAQAAAIARAKGARLTLDTSGAALKAALDHGVYLVKPNLRELAELLGQPLSSAAAWEKAARDLVAAGRAEIVALSLGAAGAFIATRGQCLRVQALDVAVKTAVGAGDSFLAAFIHRLAQPNASLADAARAAVAAGSSALMRGGTSLAMADDVAALAAQVGVEAC
ncbi:MAG: hypothetical protein Tsb0016_24580 [Sphingomonadales bacterium]